MIKKLIRAFDLDQLQNTLRPVIEQSTFSQPPEKLPTFRFSTPKKPRFNPESQRLTPSTKKVRRRLFDSPQIRKTDSKLKTQISPETLFGTKKFVVNLEQIFPFHQTPPRDSGDFFFQGI